MSIVVHEKMRDYTDKYNVCVLMGAAKAATGVPDTMVINHGVGGCRMAMEHLRSDNVPDGLFVPIISTAPDQSSVIYGGGKKLDITLEHAVVEAKKRKTPLKAMWIFTSCATSMIGDDINSAAKKIEDKYGIKVIPLDTPGFLGGEQKGHEKVFCALVDNFAKKDIPKNPNAINIIAPHLIGSKFWPWDHQEMVRLLGKADIDVNITFSYKTPVEKYENFGAACANYNLSGEDFKDFKSLSSEYGVEMWGEDLVYPIGIANTEEWYLKIAGKFGNVEKAKAQMKEDMQRVQKRIRGDYNASWFLSDISGRHIGILGEAKYAASLARCMFYDFNCYPVVVGLCGETREAIDSGKKILEELKPYCDIEIYEDPTFFEYGNALKKADVDFAIGSRYDLRLVRGIGIPHISFGKNYFFNNYNFIPWPSFGITGMLTMMTELGKFYEEEIKHEFDGYKANSFIEPIGWSNMNPQGKGGKCKKC